MRTNTHLLLWTLGCFALACASASLALAAATGTGPSFKGPIGLQLYSLRDQFAKDVPGTLDEVKKMGFRYAELAGTYGLTPDQFKAELSSRGIKPIAAHFPYEEYRDNPEAVALKAKELGLKYAGVAWIPHQGDFDEKTCREAAAVFNRAGEALAKHGLKFFYHCHGYEFQPFGQGTLFDLLMQETNPKYVQLRDGHLLGGVPQPGPREAVPEIRQALGIGSLERHEERHADRRADRRHRREERRRAGRRPDGHARHPPRRQEGRREVVFHRGRIALVGATDSAEPAVTWSR